MRSARKPAAGLYDLRARPGSVHWGYFDATLKPALRVPSGALIRAEAITHHAGDAPHLLMDDDIRALYAEIPEHDRAPGVHILTGPIYVEDALPGDMLEVRYLEMVPLLAYGSNLAAHWGHLYQEMDQRERVTIYQVDAQANLATALFDCDVAEKYLTPGRITDCSLRKCEPALRGIRVPVRPHLGTAGVAPDVAGRVSSIPPGRHGGDIDNWRIGPGATMYYPVRVPGALFSVGDPHTGRRRNQRNADRGVTGCVMRGAGAQGFPLPVAAAGKPRATGSCTASTRT
ncbi:MAG TPA: acetamidase/formamidase family protein [Acetobacteraceae bacterium]|nr:acetamidase/formamidase family protein [Acetobacteraceae bacterium]